MPVRLVRDKSLAPEQTARCAQCKKARTTQKVIRSVRFGGHTCCQGCFDTVVVPHEMHLDALDARPMSEADYQSWGRLR